MAGKKMDLGPTGEHLRERLTQLRGRMTYAELSRLLSDLGRDIPPLGLRRIEAGERRVDVDDLMALAVALGVPPVTLLMPDVADPKEPVIATGAGEQPAERLWKWLTSDNVLVGSGQNVIEFWLRAWPQWEHKKMADEVADRKRRAQAGRGPKGEQ